MVFTLYLPLTVLFSAWFLSTWGFVQHGLLMRPPSVFMYLASTASGFIGWSAGKIQWKVGASQARFCSAVRLLRGRFLRNVPSIVEWFSCITIIHYRVCSTPKSRTTKRSVVFNILVSIVFLSVAFHYKCLSWFTNNNWPFKHGDLTLWRNQLVTTRWFTSFYIHNASRI